MTAPDLLVVGGTGMLGREVVRQAVSRGASVVASFHSTDPPAPGGDVDWCPVDLRDATATEAFVTDRAPGAVVNAAYARRGGDLAAVTARAPGHLAAATARTGARLVHVSSDVVFGGTSLLPHVESDPVGPITGYGRAKARAERAVAATDPRAVVVRTSLLWGADDGPQERLVTDPGVTFFTTQIRCPLRVDRLAAAILELVDRTDVAGLLHVAGADAVDRLTFARLLAPSLGVDPASLRGAEDDSRTRPNHIVLDSALARSRLASPLPGVRADVADGPARD